MTVIAQFAGKKLTGDLIKSNPKMVVMRLDSGRCVKRHRVKHHVEVG